MPLASKRCRFTFVLLAASLLCASAGAELRPLDDGELSAVSGQGLINLDALTYGGYEYTRLNIGGDMKLLTNIDKLRMGNFARSSSSNPSNLGTVSNQAADIAIDNFALGRVDNANSANAQIVPFEIRDPYIELAFKNNGNGVREIAGVRLGFGRARGDLSGDIHSLTGTMEGYINGPASIALEYYKQTHSGCDSNCIALSLAGDAELYSKVQLVKQGTGDITQNGVPINRATQIGVANGESFQTDNASLKDLLPLLATQGGDCKASGLPACFPLLNYKSIFVGDRLNSNLATGGAQGIFFSVQGQNVPWQDLSDKSKFIQTQAGAFANFAKYSDGNKDIYPFAVALYDALRGTARVDTCIGGKGC
ncbi:MAG: hypothetical protein IPF55_12280 [Rhodoferax sp.]|nr:hypothetical protein [Rhodoferax sp.]